MDERELTMRERARDINVPGLEVDKNVSLGLLYIARQYARGGRVARLPELTDPLLAYVKQRCLRLTNCSDPLGMLRCKDFGTT